MSRLHPRWSPIKRAKKSEVSTSSLPSEGPKRGRNRYVIPTLSGVPNAKRGEKIRNGYLTLAFSGAQKRAVLLRNSTFSAVPNTKRSNEITSGYLTLAFYTAQKRAELLCDQCILGDPQTNGDKIRSGYLVTLFCWHLALGTPENAGFT